MFCAEPGYICYLPSSRDQMGVVAEPCKSCPHLPHCRSCRASCQQMYGSFYAGEERCPLAGAVPGAV